MWLEVCDYQPTMISRYHFWWISKDPFLYFFFFFNVCFVHVLPPFFFYFCRTMAGIVYLNPFECEASNVDPSFHPHSNVQFLKDRNTRRKDGTIRRALVEIQVILDSNSISTYQASFLLNVRTLARSDTRFQYSRCRKLVLWKISKSLTRCREFEK